MCLAGVFVALKQFHPSLKFASKAGGYISELQLECGFLNLAAKVRFFM